MEALGTRRGNDATAGLHGEWGAAADWQHVGRQTLHHALHLAERSAGLGPDGSG